MNTTNYDFIIIGSGFGGSVSALRLAEKGYRVAVMEMGRRWDAGSLPQSSWRIKRYIWRPALGLRGFFNMRFFKHLVVLQGNAVGGGSITYAQTLWQPKDTVWDAGEWANLADWKTLMPQHYAMARKMLGATINKKASLADQQLRKIAQDQGVDDSFYYTEVGVFFGDSTQPEGQAYPDPYFNGKGPERNGCIGCGGCMMGCRYNAKNTLDKNYLYLAERLGVTIFEQTQVETVKEINPSNGAEGYFVETRSSQYWFRKRQVFTTKHIIFSAGSLGTQELLLKMKHKGFLPRLSDKLGYCVRTNAESLIALRYFGDEDYSKGIAIGSGVFLDEYTHIEATRYPKGSDLLGSLLTVMVNGTSHFARFKNWLVQIIRHPIVCFKMMWPFGFAHQTLILLCMQTLDGSISMKLKRPWYWPFKLQLSSYGDKIPTYIPNANAFAQRAAEVTGGVAGMTLTEILLNVPMTAHCIGGAVIGSSAADGVCDAQMRVFGYENMWICDGSVISANLGVNPSLTITALAEYAMSFIPTHKINESR